MSKWKIELENIGRGKTTRTVKITANTLPQAEQEAIIECSKHLISNDIGLLDNLNLTYTVCAGIRSVGTVKITSL